MKATRVFYDKIIHENGAIEEITIWAVPRTEKHPDGVRYRLAYILNPKKQPEVLYDNHHPKGHHKHIRSTETPYDFSSVEQLLEDFKRDVKEADNHENT